MSRRVRVGLMVGFGFAAALAFSGWILRAAFEVLHGRGMETYLSGRGLQVHWVDVLTTALALVAAILVVLVATLFVAWRKRRDLAAIRKMEAGKAVASGKEQE
jgi:hypothetical protein